MKKIVDITDIHNVLFESLCYFDEFCQNNGIRYFLSNGSLLGAAKYNNFIPWDDDIDVILPRKDYDKLVKLTSINNDSYKLLCREQYPEWRMPYAKLSREDTIIKEGEYNFGLSFGLSIDIFPLDNWSPCLPLAKAQAFRSEILKRLLVCSIGGDFISQKTGLRRVILKLFWFWGKHLGYREILNSIMRIVEKSKRRKRKFSGCVAWTCHHINEVFPFSYFDKTEYLYFRDKMFPVFSHHTQYLDSLYGSWREDLPLEKQHSNHNIEVWWKYIE